MFDLTPYFIIIRNDKKKLCKEYKQSIITYIQHAKTNKCIICNEKAKNICDFCFKNIHYNNTPLLMVSYKNIEEVKQNPFNRKLAHNLNDYNKHREFKRVVKAIKLHKIKILDEQIKINLENYLQAKNKNLLHSEEFIKIYFELFNLKKELLEDLEN